MKSHSPTAFTSLANEVAQELRAALLTAGWKTLRRVTATNPVFLVQSPTGEPGFARAFLFPNGNELLALRRLHDGGLPVPQILETGALNSGIRWCVLEVLPGCHPRLETQVVVELFRLMRRMHNIDAVGLPTGFSLTASGAHDVADWATDVLTDAGADVRAAREKVLSLLSRDIKQGDASDLVLVHGDWNPGNILVEHGSPVHVTGILDPYGVAGSREQDIACLIEFASPGASTDLFALARREYGSFNENLAARWLAVGELRSLAVTALSGPVDYLQHRIDTIVVRM